MARIRSIHPGLFTDEAFVSLTMPARILLIGLWTEADDNGVFEWNALKLKMRLFPADQIVVDALLPELEHSNLVRPFEEDEKGYGAIRNFRKYQRPKSPKSVHPLPPYIMEYVGLVPQKGEIDVANVVQFPPKAEISPQMEDVVCRMEDEGGKRTTAGDARPAMSNLPEYFEASERVFAAMGLDPDDHRMWSQRSRVGEWTKVWDLDLDVLPTVSRLSVGKPPGRIKTLAFFEDAIADAYAARTKPLPIGKPGAPDAGQSSIRATLERRLAGLGDGGSCEICPPENADPAGVVLEGEATRP